MPDNISRAAFDTLKPPGNLWKPEPGEDLDNQWNGLTDAIEDAREYANSLADIRNPYKTPVFEDLERNYGIKPNSTISTAIRQARLARKVYQKAKNNTIEDLQSALDIAGFDLQVHKNDPAIDPATFLTDYFQITAGSDYAYAGYNNGVDILAFAARLGGEWLVNTEIFLQSNAYLMQAGGDIAYAGYTSDGVNSEACAGYFEGYRQDLLTYPAITDSGYWHMVYFIGGDATRDGSGYLLTMEQGAVDSNRLDELKEICLSIKNMSVWIALIITLV